MTFFFVVFFFLFVLVVDLTTSADHAANDHLTTCGDDLTNCCLFFKNIKKDSITLFPTFSALVRFSPGFNGEWLS